MGTARHGGGDSHAQVLLGSQDDDFAACYRPLFDRSMRLAYRMTRDASGSEDVAAEAMARAYAKWHTVRRMEQPEAWVMRVTVNLVIDAARRRRLFASNLPQLVAADDTVAFEDNIAVRRALVAALATLPKRQREAIAMRYLAELDDEDISRALAISSSSVRTHIQRGLAALREHMVFHAEGDARVTV